MKANKVTLIAQTVGMYVMHAPLYVWFLLGFISVSNEALTKGLLIASLVLMGVVFFISLANIGFSVASLFMDDADLSKTVMKVKFALIPWYVLNFAMCAVIVAIMLNPFMLIGIPVAIAILAGTAYFFMLSTSLPDVAYYLRRVFIKKEEPLTSNRVVTVVCLFIFCLDVIGGISFYRQNKRAQLSAGAAPSEKE